MLTPAYIPKSSSVHPNLYLAFKQFVLEYALAGDETIPSDNIYRGWQNRAALPAGSNDYAIITIKNTNRRGTTVDTMSSTDVPDDQPEIYQLRTYYEGFAQIDICGTPDEEFDSCRHRIYSLDTTFRSYVGTNFFSQYGITAQHGSNIREDVFIDESKQYVLRYGVDLHYAYWAGVDSGSAWFNSADIERVEDVDAHHKP